MGYHPLVAIKLDGGEFDGASIMVPSNKIPSKVKIDEQEYFIKLVVTEEYSGVATEGVT